MSIRVLAMCGDGAGRGKAEAALQVPESALAAVVTARCLPPTRQVWLATDRRQPGPFAG